MSNIPSLQCQVQPFENLIVVENIIAIHFSCGKTSKLISVLKIREECAANPKLI